MFGYKLPEVYVSLIAWVANCRISFPSAVCTWWSLPKERFQSIYLVVDLFSRFTGSESPPNWLWSVCGRALKSWASKSRDLFTCAGCLQNHSKRLNEAPASWSASIGAASQTIALVCRVYLPPAQMSFTLAESELYDSSVGGCFRFPSMHLPWSSPDNHYH